MNVWMEYCKMGHMRTTDVVGYHQCSDKFDTSLEEDTEMIEEFDKNEGYSSLFEVRRACQR